jgi:predicted RNase H-like nuclease (RuvC/YqgF family)
MDTTAIIAAIGGAVLGSGGASAILGTWLKYRFDSAAQKANTEAARAAEAARTYQSLAQEQESFRKSLQEDIRALKADLRQTNAENDALIKTNAELAARITTQEGKIEALTQRLTAALMERDMFLKQIEDQKKEIEVLRQEVRELRQGRERASTA